MLPPDADVPHQEPHNEPLPHQSPSAVPQPYRHFRFLVKWSGCVVAGFSKVSALRPTAKVVQLHDGALPSAWGRSPGCTDYGAITLERGVTHDREFEAWANRVWGINNGPGSEEAPKSFRKDLMIELLNEVGQVAIAFTVIRCWVSVYQARPEPDANGSAVIIQLLKLENEGWLRSSDLKETIQPTQIKPACTRHGAG